MAARFNLILTIVKIYDKKILRNSLALAICSMKVQLREQRLQMQTIERKYKLQILKDENDKENMK